jgi:predicted transcriptional regulator of viral defense system
MGKIVHIDKIREFIKTTPVFRAKDIQLITKNERYAYLILHKLAKCGEIKRVIKSWYSLYDDPVVSVFCFKPAYLGLQQALSLHELWAQEANVVIVTTRKVRVGLRKIFGSNVILHRIKGKYFFGFDYVKYGNFFIPVSDPEKTLIDLIYFKETPSLEVLCEIKKKINKKKLNKYLKNYPEKFREKLLAYVTHD